MKAETRPVPEILCVLLIYNSGQWTVNMAIVREILGRLLSDIGYFVLIATMHVFIHCNRSTLICTSVK
jgi:ABC-type arginine transport system permease subunit